MRLSATLLSTYRTCPRQYRYRYVDGLPTIETAQLAFGRGIHETLGAMHGQCVETDAPLDIDHGIRDFRRRWWIVGFQEPCLFQDDPRMRHGYRVLGEGLLRGYVEEFRTRPPALAVEFPFTVRWGEETLVGYVDRVDETDDGLEIREFKTSKRKPSRREVDEDLQLLLYSYGVGEALGLPVRRAVYHHLRSATSLPTEREAETCRSQVNDILSRVVPAIQAGRHPPKNGWWCRFCDYRLMCEREGPEEMVMPPAPVCVTASRKGEDAWPSQRP